MKQEQRGKTEMTTKTELIERLDALAEVRKLALDEGRFEDWNTCSAEAGLIEQSLKQAGYGVCFDKDDRKHSLFPKTSY